MRAMDLSHLTAADRAQIDGFIHDNPKRRAVVEKLLAQRAATTNVDKRRKLDDRLIWLVTPSTRAAGFNPTWLIVALTVVPLIVIGVHSFYEADQHETALAAGVPAVARVERVADGNCLVGQKGYRCLELSLRVWPAAGASYAASLTHDIEDIWLSRIQPGSYLTVVVDKVDPQRITFDERAMQIAAPTPPSTP